MFLYNPKHTRWFNLLLLTCRNSRAWAPGRCSRSVSLSFRRASWTPWLCGSSSTWTRRAVCLLDLRKTRAGSRPSTLSTAPRVRRQAKGVLQYDLRQILPHQCPDFVFPFSICLAFSYFDRWGQCDVNCISATSVAFWNKGFLHNNI